MSRKYSSYRLPGDLEDLSDFSNEDLRLSPEYAEIGEAYRKIRSFKEAVETLEESEAAYHDAAKAVGSAWPEAYEAFVSMDDALDDVPDKFNAELVMNSGFDDFDEVYGEVNTRYKELENAMEEARDIYRSSAASLATEIKSAMFLGQVTPLEYAKEASDSEAFDKRAEKLESLMVRPEHSIGQRALKVLDQTGAS